MTQLHTQFGSGALFTAGPSGSQIGPSGINDITDRINTHIHDGVDTPFVTQQASFGSGIQSPASYEVQALANMTNISGTEVTLVTRGGPVHSAMSCLVTATAPARITLQIAFSGTTAGVGSSFISTMDGEIDTGAAGLVWMTQPSAGSVVYSTQVKNPSGGGGQNIKNTSLSVFEIT